MGQLTRGIHQRRRAAAHPGMIQDTCDVTKKQTEMLMMPPQGISIHIYIYSPIPLLDFCLKKK